MDKLTVTYVGGPTALIEFAGTRFLTDPTFDPAGGEYPSGPATLRKTSAPALSPEQLGPIDYVLLSHDHHYDNLDRAGREMLTSARHVITTVAGASRLGGNSIGLSPWQSIDGPGIKITATPARHGPADRDRGPVVGFTITRTDAPDRGFYFAGDTVWFEGVNQVAQRFNVRVALLNLGAAHVAEVGPFHLTMTAEEAVLAAGAFPAATIVPLHFEGWRHFSEGHEQIAKTFELAGLSDRIRWPEAGRAIEIDL